MNPLCNYVRFFPKWPPFAHSMVGLTRLDNLQWCVEDALARGVPGDLMECGVWRGGAAILLRGVLKAHGVTDRLVWAADSFAGLPTPDPERYPADAELRLHEFPFLAVSLEQVRANFARYGLLDDRVRFLKGWFRDTLPGAPVERLAVLRLDGDMYESTTDALTHLYPKLSPGGYLIVDDYRDIAACRQAVDDFLALHPGCFLRYYDDTPTNDAAKALSSRAFDPALAKRKQQDHCAITFSLQAFSGSHTKEGLLYYRNLGVDIDLIPVPERSISADEADRRKEEYLRSSLLPFPLKPTWLIETARGFHAIFRIRPLRNPRDIQKAETLNRRLVRVLRGDGNATHLTQVLRVPGFFQFKDASRPFLCRLLMDNGGSVAPYPLDLVAGVVDTWDTAQGTESLPRLLEGPEQPNDKEGMARWVAGRAGVPEGQRNTTAASVIGIILCRLPVALWETAGWGGLKEWNGRNNVPLPERELRAVYDSIARREHAKRQLQRWAERTPDAGDALNKPASPSQSC